MGKIFMIGDSHAGQSPLKYKKWMKKFNQYFNDFYIPFLEKNAKEGDICIHLGDLFDNRDQIPIDVLIDVQKIVEKIASILPFHIIIGNHDLWTKSESSINSPSLYKYIPNVTVYEKPTQIELDGTKILLMPWVDKKDDMINYINTYKDSRYLFCHSDLNGAKMHLTSVAHKNPDKIEVDSFKSFEQVFSGHIHIRQSIKNFHFIGSIYHMDRNDRGNKKGITILNPSTGNFKFFENNISSEFKSYTIKNLSDYNNFLEVDTSKDYYDLVIYKSFMMESRKNKRLIEDLISKKPLETFEYFDDMVRETNTKYSEEQKVLIEKINNTNLSISNASDGDSFIDIVKQYANTIEYKDPKHKDGVLEELEVLATMYKNNNRK